MEPSRRFSNELCRQRENNKENSRMEDNSCDNGVHIERV